MTWMAQPAIQVRSDDCAGAAATLDIRSMRRSFFILLLALAGCTAPSGPVPSLAARPAEAIDPRVPIPIAAPSGVVDAALKARLTELLGEARAGNQTFMAAATDAERLVAAAGTPSSESWIAAQQSLSALVAARGQTARALSDIDAIAAQRLETAGGIAPANFAAIEAAANEVGAMSQHQAEVIDALQKRLGG
jgi:hypothetical protein